MHQEFRVNKLNEEGLKKAGQLAKYFDELLTKLEGMCPQGREFSLVKTKLEEASFFAKKSIAIDPGNQVI